jgi:HEAT repeat protein
MSILQKLPPGLSTTQAINLVAEQVKDLLYQLSKTISSIKVFSWEHAATQKMVHILWENASTFLARYGRLEIGVEEFAFTYRDRVVYRDEKAIKSLPFLFYKDGMKQLFIDKSLKERELVEFLRIIREAFEKPAEECDIVNILWERDLASIHCYAPDDFLEAKIGAGKQPPMLYADPSELRMGFIPLTPEDMAPAESLPENALEFPVPLDGAEGAVPAAPDQDSAGGGPNPEGEVFAALSDREDQALREMLQINRRLSPNGELVVMAGEILNLEANPTRFLETLDVVSRLHQDLVAKADFHWAAQLVARMEELKANFIAPNAFQREPVAAFLERLKTRVALTNLKTVVLDQKPSDFRPFFEYITVLGLETLPLFVDLCDTLRSPAFYSAMGGYLREIGTQSPSQLLHLASASRPALTREVIAALGSHPDKRVVLLLAAFKGNWDLSIKQDAIRALGRSSDPGAVRVLCDFLNDEDLDVRVFAANNIRTLPDAATSDHITSLIAGRDFLRKGLLERQAYLDLAGRQKSFAMRELLEGILRRRSGLLNRRRRTETRLAVVATLVRQGDAEAREILERGTHVPGRRVRRACREALESLPAALRPRPEAAPPPPSPAPPAPETEARPEPVQSPEEKLEPAPPPHGDETAPASGLVSAPVEAPAGPSALVPETADEVWPETMPEIEPEPIPASGSSDAPEGPIPIAPGAEGGPPGVPEPRVQPAGSAPGTELNAEEGAAPQPGQPVEEDGEPSSSAESAPTDEAASAAPPDSLPEEDAPPGTEAPEPPAAPKAPPLPEAKATAVPVPAEAEKKDHGRS